MPSPPLHLAVALGHEAADKRIDLLRRIDAAGSISEAARGAGVSYKAAWQAVETLTNLAGTALVEKAVGGVGGGGAVLTDAGRHLLRAALLLETARQDVLAQLAREPLPSGPMPGLAALGLRTSMRNQLPGHVQSLARTGASIRVALVLAAGSLLHARITLESAELLGLQPGQAVLALCKATAVRIAHQIAPQSGHNLLHGRLTRPAEEDGGEMSLALAEGARLVGFAGAWHGLRLGDSAMASVEESGVVVAVAG